MDLIQFELDYIPYTATKGQALAEFIMECTFSDQVTPLLGL